MHTCKREFFCLQFFTYLCAVKMYFYFKIILNLKQEKTESYLVADSRLHCCILSVFFTRTWKKKVDSVQFRTF